MGNATIEFMNALLFTDFSSGAIGAGGENSDGDGGEDVARSAKADAIFAVKVVMVLGSLISAF
jgi:hypothetical protein